MKRYPILFVLFAAVYLSSSCEKTDVSVPKVYSAPNSSFFFGKSFPGGHLRLLKSDGFDFFDDEVTLTLTVPVRRVLYLTWLNEKIDNPETPMPYQDEVMTTTNRRLS